MESCKREIFVYVELIEIANVIVFRINGHWVIKSLKGVSMELHSVKNELRFLSGKMLVPLEKKKLLKPEFIREISDFGCSENGKVFD